MQCGGYFSPLLKQVTLCRSQMILPVKSFMTLVSVMSGIRTRRVSVGTSQCVGKGDNPSRQPALDGSAFAVAQAASALVYQLQMVLQPEGQPFGMCSRGLPAKDRSYCSFSGSRLLT